MGTTTDTEVSAAILSCILSVFSGSVGQQQREELRDTLGDEGPLSGEFILCAASTVKLFGHSALVCLGGSHSCASQACRRHHHPSEVLQSSRLLQEGQRPGLQPGHLRESLFITSVGFCFWARVLSRKESESKAKISVWKPIL